MCAHSLSLIPTQHTRSLALVLQFVDSVGNDKANKFWEARLPPHRKISPTADARAREEFIRDKYQHKKYYSQQPAAGVLQGSGAGAAANVKSQAEREKEGQ